MTRCRTVANFVLGEESPERSVLLGAQLLLVWQILEREYYPEAI